MPEILYKKKSDSLRNQWATGKRKMSAGFYKYWQGKTRSPEDRLKMRVAKLGMIGPKANNWRGGVTPIRERIRKMKEYLLWRAEVFTRDGYACVLCKRRGGDLVADHFPKMFAEILDEDRIGNQTQARLCGILWDVRNGRTLCVSCHRKTFTGVPKKPWQNS